MNDSSMNVAMYGLMFLCAVMSVFNVLRHRKRGWGAVFLSAAFLVMGVVIYLYRTNAPDSQVRSFTIVLVILVSADFLYRASRTTSKGPK
ncbi:MAG: hypothetical protein P4L46_06815 [Fimbriimonas sp.]|nr:hypothetical protein [Fimbriimonas sp.]